MRYKLCVVMLLFFAGQSFGQDPNVKQHQDEGFGIGVVDGRKAAESVGTGGWVGASLASGLFLGLIGTGISYAIAASSEAELPSEYFATVQEKGAPYMLGFNQGYTQKLQSRRKSAALWGGLTGTAIGTAIILAVIMNSDDEYYYSYSKVPVLQLSIPIR